jgi:hypothetical protein
MLIPIEPFALPKQVTSFSKSVVITISVGSDMV